MSTQSKNIVSIIDIGTTKICVIIARTSPGMQFEVLAIGHAPSKGLQKGVVVDIPSTVHSLHKAITQAEQIANIKIENVCIGIAGSHISSLNSAGAVPIKRGVISQSDIDAALEGAKAIAIPEGKQVLHVLAQAFFIDGKHVANPIGMHAIRLEVNAHIILGAISSVEDLISCCKQAGVGVSQIVLEQIASSKAVLSQDECQLGVGLVDIGGGTSDFAVFHKGSIIHTMVLPIAGNHFTHDLAIGLRVTINQAEQIKKEHACVVEERDYPIEAEMVHGLDKQIIMQSDIVSIVQPRARELLTFIKNEIDEKKLLPFLTTGIVLTGGGSLLKKLPLLAEDIFSLQIRISQPQVHCEISESLKHPKYATSYGLLAYVIAQLHKKESLLSAAMINNTMKNKIIHTMKQWVTEFFT